VEITRWLRIETLGDGVYSHLRSDNAMPEWTFTGVIHREEDLFVPECPEVGTVSQGYM
jgi:hypothetical protein